MNLIFRAISCIASKATLILGEDGYENWRKSMLSQCVCPITYFLFLGYLHILVYKNNNETKAINK